MAINSLFSAKVGGSVAAITSIAVGATYTFTKENIWTYVKDKCIPVDLEDERVWKKAQDVLENLEDSINLSEGFKTLKQEIKTSTNQSKKDKGELLREGCFYFYGLNYKSAFGEYETGNQFIENIKTYCSIKVKDGLGAENLLKEEYQDDSWKGALNKLKKATKLTQTFKDLGITSSSQDSEFSKLKNKCKELYDQKIYSIELTNDIKTYCTYTIKEKMNDSLVLDDHLFLGKGEENESDIKGKIGESVDSNPGDDAFKKLKGNKDKWTEWRDKCQKLYKKQWDGKDANTDGDYKKADENCKKGS